MEKTQFVTELFDGEKVNIDIEVGEILFNAMCEKASELVFEAKKVMRHSRRKDLRSTDIEAAMKRICIQSSSQDSSDLSRLPTIDEEQKEDDFSSANVSIDIEWANLGGGSIINSDKRYLYNWYRNKIKAEEPIENYRN